MPDCSEPRNKFEIPMRISERCAHQGESNCWLRHAVLPLQAVLRERNALLFDSGRYGFAQWIRRFADHHQEIIRRVISIERG